MGHLTCGVCLSNLEKDGGDELSALEDHLQRTSYDELWFKLQFIGFFQPQKRDELPEYICTGCALRTEDAYELKLQCLKTSAAYCCGSITPLPIKDLNSNNQFGKELPACSEPTSASSPKNLPDPIETASNEESGTSTIPTILASAYDMFACVQSLSTTLKYNMSLLSDAIHYMENTISLLTVLFPLKEISDAIKKSVQTIKSEAESWKIRSSMLHDAASFVRQVSSQNFLSGIAKSAKESLKTKTIKSPKPTLTTTSSSSNGSVVAPSNILPDNKLISPNSSSVPNSDSEVLRKENDNSTETTQGNGNLSCDEVQFVRRSFRSRCSVDHLVYWPSFRKQGTSNSKSGSKLKSSKKCMELPRTSTEALDSLLLKREVDTDSPKLQKTVKDEKWSIVPKKKALNDTHNDPVEGIASKVEDTKGGLSKSQNSSEGSLKICGICDKVLSSNRNLQAHMKMHTGSSPFPCSYCNKSFSSGWNRAQHERVHTGVKPYVCDICQESFRYNVTLRHHKEKRHTV